MKNLKMRTKLMVGFGTVILLSVALTVLAIISLSNTQDNYQNKLDYSQTRVQTILEIYAEVFDLRRIASTIHAYSGDENTVRTNAAEGEVVFDSLYSNIGRYITLVRDDKALTTAQINELVGKAENMRSTTQQYKRDIFDPTVAFALEGDSAAISANYAANGSILTQFSSEIYLIKDGEYDLSYVLIAATSAEADTFELIFIVVAIIIVIISAVLALYIAADVSKPLSMVDKWIAVTAQGIITWSEEERRLLDKYALRMDEIGSMMKSYIKLVEYIGTISKSLSRIAEGDLTIEVHPKCDEDQLSHSLMGMLRDLNNMFAEINSASAQVSAGSKQIADGATALAQGSTEQAASVEELSASVSEIASKTKVNAELAGRAATLAGSMMHNAEKGSGQMDEMTSAVKDINAASQSISKVIKVIDDIAFQTNILALNAAVEAARAGQHGKGFAVVAEEVRNLAAKSAEAAKDTGGLIQNSMEKAELGARIAGDTAESLNEIVAGIKESTEIVSEIAKSSDEQTQGIGQIDSGINQVAQVVQQNSATAQESAAASEEMSGQSSMLEQLISKFKLSSQGNTFRSLPPSASQANNPASLPAMDSVYDSTLNEEFGKY
ncbi:MAG: methyl-accepting chemotaxis protein [Oscillospiraceae bacterium]|nr:methyl-accepting chemotaxis protein [Oscillospiraceae bacterium]